MRKLFFAFIFSIPVLFAAAQSNILPADKQKTPIVITNATIHKGNGEVIENASIVIVDGKITGVGKNVSVPAGAEMVDAKGKQVYPGIILPTSSLGLIELSSIKASTDVREM